MRIFIIFLILLHTISYGKLIFVDGESSDYLIQTIPPSTNIMLNSFINAIDNNLGTSVVVNLKYRPFSEIVNPFFRIIFKQPFLCDKIVIYIGNQKNDKLFKECDRPKELFITVLESFGEKNKDYTISLTNTYFLVDKMGGQAINFGKIIKGNVWIFDILATFNGNKSNDIYISEIEFWYKGKKYEVANLEEAKREFIEKRKLRWYIMLVSTTFDPVETAKVNKYVREKVKTWQGNEFECDLTTNSMNIFKEMGFDMNKYLYQYGGDIKNPIIGWKIYLEFGLDKKIYFFKRVNERETEEAYLWDYEKVKIGEWDVDKMGTLWIKLDGREKKAALDERLRGTDLEFLDPIELDKGPNTDEGYNVIGLRKYKVIGIRKTPTKQWWEFWKSYKKYSFKEAPIFLIRFAEGVEDFWIFLRKAYRDNALIWMILNLSCLIFAIVRRESNTPLWTRIMSIVNPIYILGLILLNFIFSRNLDFLITGIFVMLGLVLCIILSLSLLVILIIKWKNIKIFDKIGYFLYAIFVPLSCYFILDFLY